MLLYIISYYIILHYIILYHISYDIIQYIYIYIYIYLLFSAAKALFTGAATSSTLAVCRKEVSLPGLMAS